MQALKGVPLEMSKVVRWRKASLVSVVSKCATINSATKEIFIKSRTRYAGSNSPVHGGHQAVNKTQHVARERPVERQSNPYSNLLVEGAIPTSPLVGRVGGDTGTIAQGKSLPKSTLKCSGQGIGFPGLCRRLHEEAWCLQGPAS